MCGSQHATLSKTIGPCGVDSVGHAASRAAERDYAREKAARDQWDEDSGVFDLNAENEGVG